MMSNLKLDFLGNFVAVGDRVAYNPPRWKGLVKGTIVSFTPKGFRVLPDSAKDSGKTYEEQLKWYTSTIFELIKIEEDKNV